MKTSLFLPLAFFVILFFVECGRAGNNKNGQAAAEFPYDVENPDKRYSLPAILDEISGLSYWKENQALSVQDEDGIVFVYDFAEEKIVERIRFAGGGDYEGVEAVGDHIYVVRSDGDLYRISRSGEAEIIETELRAENDVEALSFLPGENLLALACKEAPGLTEGSATIEGKAVYAFDLARNELIKEPFLVVKNSEIEALIANKGLNKKRHMGFKPSGIAIHPVNGEIYVVHSKGKLLARFSSDGRSLLDIAALDPDRFEQPEGICFDEAANLYISNEGKGGKANILRFAYQKKN